MSFLRGSGLSLVCLTSVAGACLYSSDALAAERVVLKYGIFRQSVSVADLTAFAESDDPSLAERYRISEKDSQQVRTALTKQIPIDAQLLDRGLNNPLGDRLLDEIGQSIQAPSDEASRAAMRSALVLAASDDGKLSLLEVIQKYPTRDVYVDAKRLSRTYNRIAEFQGQIRKVLGGVVDWF